MSNYPLGNNSTKRVVLAVLILCFAILSACGENSAKPTIPPSETLTPTQTPTQTLTQTPPPTATSGPGRL